MNIDKFGRSLNPTLSHSRTIAQISLKQKELEGALRSVQKKLDDSIRDATERAQRVEDNHSKDVFELKFRLNDYSKQLKALDGKLQQGKDSTRQGAARSG